VTDYDELRLFTSLAETLHFGRTARESHISPSGLSRAIQRLESELGVDLFVRDRHTVALTPAGETLRRHAERVLLDWDVVRQEVRRDEEVLTGTLRIYCTVTAAQSLLPGLVADFRLAYPDIHLDVETGYAADALDRVAGSEVDAAVAALPARLPSALTAKDITTTPVVFVAPTTPGPIRAAVERRRIDWSSVPLILPARGLSRTYADRWLRDRRIKPVVYAEVQGHEAILSLVALGCGVGVVPRLVLDKSALRGTARAVDVRPPLESFRIGLCVRKRALGTPLLEALWSSIPSIRSLPSIPSGTSPP
jgi:LysR family transcriptional regulator, positive regulator for ilvC